jgi:hypothetical protein
MFCEASPNDSVACAGRCVGELAILTARAECEAAIEAESRMSVQCTLPRVSVDYQLDPSLDAETAARFQAGMRLLQQRLPYLLAALARAEQIASAGTDLDRNARSAVEIAAESSDHAGNFRVLFGLRCALGEIDHVREVVDAAGSRLTASVDDALAATLVLRLQ